MSRVPSTRAPRRTTRLTIGVDEAGRGPAMGPMTLAVVLLDSAAARRLSREGVMDSKAVGAGDAGRLRRRELAARIVELARWHAVAEVPVARIDAAVATGGLNRLEQSVAAELLHRAPAADVIIADGERLFAPLRAQFGNLLAVNRGEAAHVAVAAASIVAKDARDRAWAAVCERYAEYGPITGGGYVNDGTARFLRAYVQRHGALPPEARTSWPHPYVADILPSMFSSPSGSQLTLL